MFKQGPSFIDILVDIITQLEGLDYSSSIIPVGLAIFRLPILVLNLQKTNIKVSYCSGFLDT